VERSKSVEGHYIKITGEGPTDWTQFESGDYVYVLGEYAANPRQYVFIRQDEEHAWLVNEQQVVERFKKQFAKVIKRPSSPVTGEQMCEFIANWLRVKYDVQNACAKDIWEMSPDGSLFHVFNLYEQAKQEMGPCSAAPS
jgi:hypothetical protein